MAPEKSLLDPGGGISDSGIGQDRAEIKVADAATIFVQGTSLRRIFDRTGNGEVVLGFVAIQIAEIRHDVVFMTPSNST